MTRVRFRTTQGLPDGSRKLSEKLPETVNGSRRGYLNCRFSRVEKRSPGFMLEHALCGLGGLVDVEAVFRLSRHKAPSGRGSHAVEISSQNISVDGQSLPGNPPRTEVKVT